MTREQETKQILKNIFFEGSSDKKNKWLIFLGGSLLLILGGLFLAPQVVGQAILINCVFWVGISLAGITFSSIFTITDAFWGRPIKRLAESLSSFLPIGILLFFLLFFFGNTFFEWYDHDRVIHAKEWWLNIPFFVGRNIFIFVLVLVFIYFYLKNSIRPDIILAKKLGINFQNFLALHLSKNALDAEIEIATSYKKNRKITPILIMIITLVTSIIAFDWVMSIDQEWFSTMFGVQYFVSSMISAGAFLMLLVGFLREKFGLQDYISLNRYHDLSKLTFAFTIGWTYMVFAQVLVIWYANLPEETPYMILRMKSTQWGWMFWLLFVMIFINTFFGLMSRTVCRSISLSRIFAVILLIGLWLEKYFLIVPSMQENALSSGHLESTSNLTVPGFEFFPFVIDVLVGFWFLSVFLFGIFYFIKRIPMMPISDYRFFGDFDH